MLIQARLYWLKRGVPNAYRPYAIKSLKACNVLLKKKINPDVWKDLLRAMQRYFAVKLDEHNMVILCVLFRT